MISLFSKLNTLFVFFLKQMDALFHCKKNITETKWEIHSRRCLDFRFLVKKAHGRPMKVLDYLRT